MPDRERRDSTITWGLALMPFPTGAIMALMPDRFSAASWRFASGMPGGYPFWGGVIIVAGILMVVALTNRSTHHHGRNELWFVGMFLVGLWWVGLSILFLVTAIADPTHRANPLAVPPWAGLGLLYWAWAWSDRKRFQ